MIDFGINVGSELSGNHFGIILNKTDNVKNNTLTVLPLTSKENRYNLKLDEMISDKSIALLDDYMDKENYVVTCISKCIVSDVGMDNTPLKNAAKIALSLAGSCIEIEEARNCAKREGLYQNNLLDIEKLNKRALLGHNKISKIHELDAIYKKYHKTSYVSYTKIQTISKDRIIYINEYDPCGKIKVSNETLNMIDNKIIEIYTNKISI